MAKSSDTIKDIDSIPFTQYLRPDGRKKSVVIERAPEINRLAHRLINEHQCYFDIEVLTTGDVSMTCERGKGSSHQVLSWEVVPNGPEVPKAVDRLVQRGCEVVGIPVGAELNV